MPGRRDAIAFLPGAAGDRALVARLAAGEDDAYRECYQLHAPALLRVLVRVVRSQARAEELLQDTFVAAFRAVGSFRGETRLSTWLTGIALRRAWNSVRDDARRRKNTPPPPEGGPGPEPWLTHRDALRRVLSLLDEMDEPKRLALLLQAEGHTAAEIAELTGEPRGTILSRLARGRAELAERAAEAGLAALVESLEEAGRP